MKAGTLGFGGDPYLRSSAHISKVVRVKPNSPSAFSASTVLQKIFEVENLQQPAAQEKIENLLGKKTTTQISSLRSEPDPRVFYQGLLNLGRELEEDGHPACALLYSALTQNEGFPALAQEARESLAALHGEGRWARRFPGFARELFTQATDAPSLFAMVAGGISYRFVKGGLAGWLLAGSELRTAETLLAKSFAIHSGALMTEAAVFTTAAKLSGGLIGRKIDWDPAVWGQDWARTALFLGNLRVFGFGFEQIGKGLQKAGWAGARTPWLLGQMGMYTGILSAHRAEVSAGLASEHNSGNPFTRAFVDLIHFNVASRVSGHVTSKEIRNWEKQLEVQTEALLQNAPKNFLSPELTALVQAPALAMAAPPGQFHNIGDKVYWEPEATGHESLAPGKPILVYSEGSPTGSGPTSRERCQQILGEAATPEVMESLDGIEEIFNQEGRFYGALERSQFRDPQKLALALNRVYKTLRSINPDKAERNYADIIVAASITERFQRGRILDLDPILKFYSEGGSIRELEVKLASDLRDQQLKTIPQIGNPLAQVPELVQIIEGLTLSRSGRLVILQYAERFLQPSANAKPDPEKLQTRLIALRSVLAHPAYVPLVEAALKVAAGSPLGGWRVGRILRSAVHDETDTLRSKLRELSDDNFQIIRPHFLLGFKVLTRKIDGTQFNAYYDDPQMARLFRRIYWDLNTVMNPEKSAERRARTDQILRDFWQRFDSDFLLSLPGIVHLFSKFGDPYSQRVVKDLENGRLELEFLDQAAFSERVKRSQREQDFADSWKAVYSPPGLFGPKGLISMRKSAFDLTEDLTREEGTFELLKSIVHEHRHSYNLLPGQRRNLGVIVRQEIDSHAMEYYWSALHGDPKNLKMTLENGSGGIALYLRHVMEYIFGGYFEKLKKK